MVSFINQFYRKMLALRVLCMHFKFFHQNVEFCTIHATIRDCVFAYACS